MSGRPSEPFAPWIRERLRAAGERQPVVIGSPPAPEHFKLSSILVPMWPDEAGRVKTLLTLRPAHMGSHAGQISFPGGRVEKDDATLLDTALREAREEVGIDPGAVEVLARLDDHWSIHHFIVTPYVGWLGSEPVFHPEPSEIERLIVADVEDLMFGSHHRVQRVARFGVEWDAHEFLWQGDRIWGMTALVLRQMFLRILGEPVPDHELGAHSLARFLTALQTD